MKAFRAAFAALLLLASFQTQAAVGVQSVQIVPSADGTLYSAFPAGDGPTDPGTTCDVPSGWACASIGDGTGTIDKQSDTEWDFDVIGSNNTQNHRFAYKDAGAGDVQFVARITADYAGSTANFASLGIGLREATTQDAYFLQCHSLQVGARAIQANGGEAGSYTAVNGATDQARPRYCGITYDLSSCALKVHESGDGSTWTEVDSRTRCMSDVIAYAFGQSNSASVSFQGTLDNIALGSTITIYTPEDPPEDDEPQLLSAISNQDLTQGISFSLCVSSNFSGADSYTATGLPSGSGLSFNTTNGCVTGTPDSDDVSASPFNVEFCAVNAFGSACDIALFSVVSASGDVFEVPTQAGTAQRVYDCSSTGGAAGSNWSAIRTSGSGTRPQAGDTIVLESGTHRGKLVFRNCFGTDSSRIRIINETGGSNPVLLEKTTGAGGGFWFTCTNCINVDLDGTGGWSGSSGHCGVNDSFVTDDECGIQIKPDASDPQPTAWVKFNGTSSKYSIKGVLIDAANATGSSSGIGIDLNDHTVKNDGSNPYTGAWREDITISHNALKTIGTNTGEGMYAGPNAGEDDLPLRRVEISYNWVDDAARECINGKYWRDGPNSVHHNVIVDCSSDNAAGQIRGINITDGGDVDIYSNIVIDTKGVGISHIINSANAADPGDSAYYSNIYNNIVIRPTGAGIFIEDNNAAQDQITPVVAEYNTIITAGGDGVEKGDGDGSCVARNNIIAPAKAVTNCTSTNNRTGSVASQNFANAGSDDYRLTSSSPARQGATGSCPNVDYEGDARPQQGTCDQGADEYKP